jgi:hypothetical protein
MDDGELKSVVKVVKEYGSEVPSLVDLVKRNATAFGAIETRFSLLDFGWNGLLLNSS